MRQFKIGDIVYFMAAGKHKYKITEIVQNEASIVTPSLSYVIQSLSCDSEMRCYGYEIDFADNGLQRAVKRINKK